MKSLSIDRKGVVLVNSSENGQFDLWCLFIDNTHSSQRASSMPFLKYNRAWPLGMVTINIRNPKCRDDYIPNVWWNSWCGIFLIISFDTRTYLYLPKYYPNRSKNFNVESGCRFTVLLGFVLLIHQFLPRYFWQHITQATLQWRHNERNGVSNYQPNDCLPNCLFRRKSKKTSKLRVTGHCEGKSPVTSEFPSQNTITRKMVPFDDIIMRWLMAME